MKTEEFGTSNEKTIVMLHGAHFVHSFGRQYPLAEKYHIIVPHLMGFGEHTEEIFQTEKCVDELADFIGRLHKKVMLVGFSLGAQLAFRLAAEHQSLFECALLVSPWLIKSEASLCALCEVNLKQLRQLKNKRSCGFIGLMNGLPKDARKEFVEQMQHVEEETVRNMVYNGISLESVPAFGKVSLPVVALAGQKEPQEVRESVKRLAELNPNCKYEIWEKAAHNIPPIFYKRFNELICGMY